MKTWKIFLIIFAVAAVCATVISALEAVFGAANVFVGALVLLPIVTLWCVATARSRG